MPRLRLAAALAVLAAGPAAAGEVAFGLGIDDVLRSDPAPALALEFRADPRWRFGALEAGLGAAGEADGDGDLWAGGGLVANLPVANRWRLEGSLMLGIYADGSGNDLGASFPVFRTQLGASVALTHGWRAGLALNHKSHADIRVDNPGVETLLLTFSRRF